MTTYQLPLQGDPRPVAVLFAMSPSKSGKWDSPYRSIPGCDVWDRERDATRYDGKAPVVAHPPCRAWGRLVHFAKPREGERGLACYAVACVRRFGGVLEHPADSKLWPMCFLPAPGEPVDAYGGYTIEVEQYHWGHRCEKRTWLYIVGCPRIWLPPMPRRDGRAECEVAGDGERPGVGRFERMHTPPEFARWLVELARRCTIPLN